MTAVYNAGALVWSYGYDCEDRLVSYSNAQSTGLHGDNEYTGLGGRCVLHDSTGGRWQFNDGQDATSTLLTDGIKNYNPGLGEYSPWAGAYYDYNSDSLGSVVGLLAPNQTEQEGYSFDAFGNSARTEGSTAFPQGQVDQFAAGAGYQTDNDTGLVRCGNRYYNPYFGRFITQDPVGDGDNWYAYCGNDPSNGVDPNGEADIPNIGPVTKIIPNPSAWDRAVGNLLYGLSLPQWDGFSIKNLKHKLNRYWSAHAQTLHTYAQFGGSVAFVNGELNGYLGIDRIRGREHGILLYYGSGASAKGAGVGISYGPSLGVGTRTKAGFLGNRNYTDLDIGPHVGVDVSTNSSFSGLAVGLPGGGGMEANLNQGEAHTTQARWFQLPSWTDWF